MTENEALMTNPPTPPDAIPSGDTRPPFSWQGAVALALAIGIFASVITICVAESVKLINGQELSAPGINFLTAVLSTLTGATATFLGRVNSQATTTTTTTAAGDTTTYETR